MQKITRKHLRAFLEQHATETVVLDIGAGHVSSNHSYTQFFPNRHTVDIDPARQPDTIGDIHSLPFADASFEVVLCTEVLEHCTEPHTAISELYRVLQPGGKCILTTRFMFPLHDAPHDYFRFTKYGLQHLFRDWNDVAIEAETQTLSALGALFQRLGFQTTLRGGKGTKALVYASAWLLDRLNFLLREEFGNIQKTQSETTIMSTGYYVVAYKPITS